VAGRFAQRGRSRRKGKYAWTATNSEPLIIAQGDFLAWPVVDMILDIGGTALAQQEATLMRIRGYIDWVPVGIDAGNEAALMAVALVLDKDEDPGTTPPGTVGTYTHEDVLWTGGGMYQMNSAIPTDTVKSYRFDLDIKSKRRLKSGQIVYIVTQNVGGVDVAVIGAIRGLLLVN